MNPNNWFTVGSFCAIANIISVSYGLLVKYQKLAFKDSPKKTPKTRK